MAIHTALITSFHPLFFFMSGLFAGVSCYFIPLSLGFIWLLIFAVFIAFCAYRQHCLKAFTISLLIGFGVGYLRSYIHQQQASFTYTNQPIDIYGTVDAMFENTHRFFKSIVVCTTQKIKPSAETEWVNIQKTIKIYCKKRPSIYVGDQIKLSGLQCKKNDNQELQQYLHKEGMHAIAFCEPIPYELISRPQFSFYRMLNEIYTSASSSINSKLSKQTASLFSAVFLGNKAAKKQTEPIAAYFKQWGILHQLARSGLHLVILVGSWYLILRCVPIPFLIKQILLLLLSLTYGIFSVSSISFLRSLGTFVLHKLLVLLKIPSNMFHLLTIVCCAVIIYNPIHIFFLDFQLSFLLTFGLIWIHGYLP